MVRIFREHGVETCQSCQGGEGHSYRYPSVDILNGPWKALDVANDYGIPVIRIGHLWSIRNGEPEETIWRIEFSPSGLTRLREQWYDQEDRDRAELHAWEQAHAMEAVDA